MVSGVSSSNNTPSCRRLGAQKNNGVRISLRTTCLTMHAITLEEPMKKKVLFICSHNSARSQMAEMFSNEICGGQFKAHSAGLEPGQLSPAGNSSDALSRR